jgi:FtsH-binding integral membrane protein
VLGFILLEALLLSSDTIRNAAISFVRGGKFSWLIVLGVYMVASWAATRMAHSFTSKTTQYAGLALFTVIEALIFLPLLGMLTRSAGGDTILLKAVLITGGLFLGLSTIAVTTKKDLSGMGRFVKLGLWIAMGLIVTSILFGFNLGVFFIGAMIILMAACILWQTNQIAREYPSEGYVGGAVVLFASLTTLLWYVIQFLWSFAGDD